MNLSISIVVPVYNEQDSVEIFYERLIKTIQNNELSDDIYEILFIDNCSTDETYAKLVHIYDLNDSVKIIRHSRNFGYQASILCGLNEARGAQILFIDVDCEDPPEMIAVMAKEYRSGGYDLVYGERFDRDESRLIKILRKFFYRISKFIADSEFIIDMAEFAIISNRMRNEIIKNKTTFPFVRSDFAYVGFASKGVRYKRAKRAAGKTHYNFFKMLKFAIAGMLTISTFPLRLVSYSGISLAVLLVAGFIVDQIIDRKFMSIELLLGTLLLYMLICNSIFALYVSRVYKDGVQRPVYIIDHQLSKLRISQ
ncbi:MAG: hypothetical protein RLZZ196_1230 [Bacteroidota bacterium]|jgi:dolichol-phosphate mannosyltransferase